MSYLKSGRKSKLHVDDVDGAFKMYFKNVGNAEGNDLISKNLRLVIMVARKYVGLGLSFMDLIQEGNIGLLKAIEMFDASKKCKFSTYAVWWIRQTISRALRKQATINDRYEDLPAEYEMPVRAEQEDVIYRAEVSLLIDEVLDACNNRERDVIKMRFGLGEYNRRHTLNEVARKHCVTKERIRQIEESVLYRLKRIIEGG